MNFAKFCKCDNTVDGAPSFIAHRKYLVSNRASVLQVQSEYSTANIVAIHLVVRHWLVVTTTRCSEETVTKQLLPGTDQLELVEAIFLSGLFVCLELISGPWSGFDF